METLIIMAAVALANWALHKWVLKPDQQRAKAAAIGDVSLPRATEDAPVPLLYGRVKVKGGNVVWYGRLTAQDITDGDGNVTGYNYYLPFQMVLGIPGGGSPGAKLGYVWLDDKICGLSLPWMTTNGQAFISPDSGPTGLADWYGGDPALGYTSASGFFEGTVLPDAGETPSVFPTYKGCCLLTFYQAVSGGPYGFLLGDSVSPGALAFEVQADCAGLVDPSLGAIGKGDANPVNVLYDLLTNKFARLGLDPALIDLASFTAAGQTFASEQLGFSLVLYNSNDARTIIREILSQTGSLLFQDFETQKIKLKPIRNDYTIGALPIFDASNVLKVSSFAMQTWSDTYNEVRVVYTDRDKEYTERTAFATDLANYDAQNATPRVLELRFPGVSNVTTAAVIAARELRAVSRPLRRARLVLNRAGFTLRPGDVFVFQWPDYGLSSGVVMRVQKFDIGTFDANGITIDCVEDVFSIDSPYLAIPPRFWPRASTAFPLVARIFDEAPRYLQAQAVGAGRFNDIDRQHAWYLAVAGTNDASFQGKISTDAATFYTDGGRTNFPGTALVHTTYARASDPYDTTTGLVIDSVVGWTPRTLASGLYSVAQQISLLGANLLRLGNEIIAYETATNLGGGQWRLDRVWRGLLDTVPADHAVGDRVYQLSQENLLGIATYFDVNLLGTSPIAVGQLVYGRERPYDASGAGLTPETDLPIDSLTIRGRTLLPYPVADLQLAASKTPAALQEEGVDVTWKIRTRLNTSSITRGDAASETAESGATFDLRCAKLGLVPAAAVDLQTGLASSTVAITRARLSKAGHGLLSPQIRSQGPNGRGWQDAALPITAYFWRNLLMDPRFAFNDGSWTVTSGSGAVASTGGLGNGPYLSGASGPGTTHFIFNQVADVTGYAPVRLGAHLAWYAKNTTAGDTVKATITALDASNASLGTSTTTITPSATTWSRTDLYYLNLPSGTVKLKVEIECAPVGAGSPTSRISELCLRLGQSSGSQLLSNADFGTGSTAGWTVAAGTFAISSTAPLYLGSGYATDATLSTTNTLRQDVALPAGYAFGTAILEVGRGQPANTGPGKDSGEVKLQALDGGGAVLATATTGAETFNADTWTRRRLTLDLPATTATIRVQVDIVAGGATNLKAAIDDFSLYVWKHLDPDSLYTARFDTPPVQPLPSDQVQFEVAFPSCPAPTLLMYDGSSVRAQMGHGDMLADLDVEIDSAFVGAVQSDGTDETSCFDFSLSYAVDAGARDVHAASDVALCNFTTDDRFAAFVAFKGGATPSTGIFGLCGRHGANGWSLRINNGVGEAVLEGAGGTVVATGTTVVTDGGLHFLACAYDGTNWHLYDEAGDHSVAAAAAGDFHDSSLSLFRIGRADQVEKTIAGQIARVYVWSAKSAWGIAAPTYTQIRSTWTHGTDPSAAITTYTRTGGSLVVPAKDGVAGARAVRYGAGQYAIAYQAGLASSGTGYGLANARPCTNLCTDQDQGAGAAWASGGAPVLTNYYPGPEGLYTASLIQGANTAYRELSGIAIGAVATTAYVIFYVQSGDGAAYSMRARICDSTGATVDTFDVPLTADGKWIRVAHAFAWSGATATMKLRLFPSNSASSHTTGICGPYFVGKDGFMPLAYGVTGVAASAYASLANAFPVQLNAEGELVVQSVAAEAQALQGTLAALRNGTNNNDKRRLYLGSSSGTSISKLDHYDGAAAANTAATTGASSYSDRTALCTERGRWCQAEVFDTASVFSEVMAVGLASGRAATWTRGSVAMAQLDVGHDNGADVFAGVIRSVQVSARETKL